MIVYDYVTGPTETRHLMRQDNWLTGEPMFSICGLPVDDTWEFGDETLSGIVATCGSCRRIMTREKENA